MQEYTLRSEHATTIALDQHARSVTLAALDLSTGETRSGRLADCPSAGLDMDGKARWVDSVLVERWLRSLKSECLRISEYETPGELRKLMADCVEQYNHVRPHQPLDYDTPASWHYLGLMAA